MSDADKFDRLAAAKAHFRAMVAERATTITVPEWDLSFYVKPTTLAQRDAQFQRGQSPSLINAAHLIIERALVDDQPMFSPVELQGLLHQVDSAVLLRVSAQIVAFDRRVWGELPADDDDKPLGEVEQAKKD